ncbi:MAG: protein-export chaperone SecB, partial [Pseudomonadota bacterium]|nr:protein-export chaperone SecB [Pseudomonadota bacterium]
MADTSTETPSTESAGTEAKGGGNGQAEAASRQIVVHAQYIKDLSFENPNAPDILINPPQQPDVQIGV